MAKVSYSFPKLTLALFLLISKLLVAASPSPNKFNIVYHPHHRPDQRNCCIPGLGCFDIAQGVCCDAPPHPASFPEIKAAGHEGNAFVAFFSPARDGRCDRCRLTGSINHYYDNRNPFDVATVYEVRHSRCHHASMSKEDLDHASMSKKDLDHASMSKEDLDTDMAIRSPAIEPWGTRSINSTQEGVTCGGACSGVSRINAVFLGGLAYDISGKDIESISEDLIAQLPDDQLIAKWGLGLHKGQDLTKRPDQQGTCKK